jgi:NADH-quinone oxidoreductase subunit F
VDLHLIPGAVATPEERETIDAVLGGVATRSLLLPALHAAHARIGWISEGALNHISERLSVPPAEAYGVASFYDMFSMKPQPPTVVHVCDDIACRINGAEALCRELEERVGKARTPSTDGSMTWRRSPCLGQCDRAPARLVQNSGAHAVDETLTGSSRTQIYADPARLLRRVGVADPERLDEYRAHHGYEALTRALALGPAGVIREVNESRLVGRGGALFPTGRKWEAVARAAVRPHYMVCNADESEPGTFKDRVLMEEDPFAVIESMTIAAYATGCERGYIYIRGEYPLATARLDRALAQARAAGLLGERVMDTAFRFDIELRRGAGAYICGEETALFNSIEGFRGEPRNKPPFPVECGLFGKPTVVNNVETLANVLDIVRDGGAAFAAIGAGQSTGTKLFCLSGCVARPGLYEVPFGITLRALIERAGGVRDGRPLQAVLLGGAAGVFLTPDEIDCPLTVEGTRAANATLGSGVVMLFDDRVDLRDTTMRIAEFFRHESCGQCVPCRVGTVRQDEALHRLAASPLPDGQASALIDDLAQAMRDASICGLGQTASSAVQSAIRKLRVFG